MPHTAHLCPALDLTAAAPLAAELLQHRGAPLAVDGSAVERLGGQCLQVLLAARATWQADGHEFQVVAPSPALVETLGLLGAASLLSPPAEEPAA